MIISPLKVWVQNILPVVYDDSLSYLEIVAKINAKTNEIISQTNENTHAIETLANTIAELGDIDELRALLDEIQTIVEDLYSTDAPLMDGTASAGSADHAARSDHVHPHDTDMLSSVNPQMDGTTSAGIANTAARSDHVHPSDTSKAPVNHASNETTYGIGDASNYGHVKITDNINNSDAGTAIKATAVKAINDKLTTFARENFIKNWFFNSNGGKFPINQRGQTSYSNVGYYIDNWYSIESGTELIINTSEITITQSNENSWEMIYQKIENYKELAGKTVRLSAYGYRSNKIVAVSLQDNSNHEYGVFNLGTELGVYGATIELPSELNNGLLVRILPDGSSSGSAILHLKAIKLELGTEQTLAHNEGTEQSPNWIVNKIPDYSEELAKCQRYYQLFRTEALRPTYGEDCRPTMATEQPTKGTLIKGGVTYYTLSSET